MDHIKSIEEKVGESLPIEYKIFLDSDTSKNYKLKFFSRILSSVHRDTGLPPGYKGLIQIGEFFSKEDLIKRNNNFDSQYLIDFQEEDNLPDSFVEAKYLYCIVDCDSISVYMSMRGRHKGKIYVVDNGDYGITYQCASINDFIESIYDLNDVKCTLKEIRSAIRLGDLTELKKLMEKQNGKLLFNKDSYQDRRIFKLAFHLNRKEIVKYFLEIKFYGFDEAKKQNLID